MYIYRLNKILFDFSYFPKNLKFKVIWYDFKNY